MKVAALMEGVLKSMLLSKLKIATVGLLVVALALAGGAGAIWQTEASPAPKLATDKGKEGEQQKEQPGRPAMIIDGWVDGKKFQPHAKMVEGGAKAAAKLVAASNLTDFLDPFLPINAHVWNDEVLTGIKNKRPYLRIQFGNPKDIDGNLNGNKTKFRLSEVVFFEPGENGPVCLWGRDGSNYYFANQIAGHEELVKWLNKAQVRQR